MRREEPGTGAGPNASYALGTIDRTQVAEPSAQIDETVLIVS